jgi:hypothetical protein
VKLNHIFVCQSELNSNYFLRVFLDAGEAGVIKFETNSEFSKKEADYRAVRLSAKYGFNRDELPTHPEKMSYPKGEINV